VGYSGGLLEVGILSGLVWQCAHAPLIVVQYIQIASKIQDKKKIKKVIRLVRGGLSSSSLIANRGILEPCYLDLVSSYIVDTNSFGMYK